MVNVEFTWTCVDCGVMATTEACDDAYAKVYIINHLPTGWDTLYHVGDKRSLAVCPAHKTSYGYVSPCEVLDHHECDNCRES